MIVPEISIWTGIDYCNLLLQTHVQCFAENALLLFLLFSCSFDHCNRTSSFVVFPRPNTSESKIFGEAMPPLASD